ncbi:MAG: ACT domain-containing protein [Ignavibacteriaceae bacterium]
MEETRLSLSIMPKRLAVCRLEKNAPIPSWATDDTFFSISRTDNELSIVCPENRVPNNIEVEKNWRTIKVLGPLGFSLTGILASIANALSEAKISIFAISTFDTDYILVKNKNLERAIKVLSTFCNVQR